MRRAWILFLSVILINNLHAQPGCTDSYEPNQSDISAYSLFSSPLYQTTTSKTITSKITKDDQDWYKIGLDYTGTLTIDLTTLPDNYDVELYGKNGLPDWIDGSEKSGTSSEKIVYDYSNLQSTIVYVKVYGHASSNFNNCSNYTLKVSWAPSCSIINLTPVLKSPGSSGSPGTTISTLTPTFDWEDVPGATDYGVYVRDMLTNLLIFDNACATSSSKYTIPSGTLVAGRTYRWNVKATVNCGSCISGYSSVLYFTTPSSTNTCSAPTTQARNLTFSNVTASQIKVSWDKGNGDRRIVKINTSNSFTAPGNGTDPSANSTYSGSGEKTVYNGTGSNVTVTGLSSNTTYWFRIYEANCTGSDSKYYTSTATNNPKNQTTAQEQGCIPPSITSDVNSSYNFCQGQTASVSIAATGPNLSYKWQVFDSFGDWVGISNQTSNIFSIKVPGTFRCVVSNSCDVATSNTTIISFTDCNGPVANFSAAKGVLVAEQAAQFTDESTGNPTAWSWVIERELFNGNTIPYKISTNRNPSVTFNSPGCFKVTLTVSNANGSNALSKPCYIYVKPHPNSPIPETVAWAHNYYSYSAGDPVNTATGAFTFSMRDLTVQGVAGSVSLERNYNSRDASIGLFGKGWHFNYDIWIDISNDALWKVHHGDGHLTYHVPYPGGETRSLYPGNPDSLSFKYNGSVLSFIYTLHNGTIYNFTGLGPKALLTSIVTRNGNTMTFSYQGGLITDIIVPDGRQFAFTHQAQNRVASIRDNLGRTVHFFYSPDGIYLDSTTIGNSTTRFTYDSYGLTEIIDPRGNRVVKNTYAPGPVVIEQHDVYGRMTKFEYKTEEGTTSITNPVGKKKVITHDESLRPIYIKDEVGNAKVFSFSSNNALEFIVNERKAVTRNFFDERNNLTKSINAKFNRDSIAYSTNNEPVYVKDKAGNVTTFTYDSKGNRTKQIAADSGVTEWRYNQQGLDTLVTDAKGIKTRKTYNSFGDLIALSTPTGVWKYTYDAIGRIIARTDPTGKTDSLFYNYFDQIIKTKDPLGRTVEYTYDLNGNRIMQKDKEGRIIKYEYDKKDNLITIIEPINRITRLAYDSLDRRSKLILPDNNKLFFEYDDVGRLTEIRDSTAGMVKSFEYYEDGTLKKEGNEFGKKWTYVRDELGLVKDFIDPLGNTLSYEYNKNNLVATQTDARRKTTLFSIDALNRINKVTDPMNGTNEKYFDKNGNLDSLRDANGTIQKFIYDESNRLVQHFDGSTTRKYVWDGANNLIKETDGLNNSIEYRYNGVNELQSIIVNGVQEKYFSRNKNGEIDSAKSKSGTYIFTRNAAGWISTTKDVWGNTISYEHDSVGHITAIVYPGGKRVEYTWGSLNRLVSVKDWYGRTYHYTWFNQGKLSGYTLPNGTATKYTIDDAYRYSSKLNKKGETVFQSNIVSYDTSNIGKDTGILLLKPHFSIQNNSGVYDAGDVLKKYGEIKYTHDANGNRAIETGNSRLDVNSYQYTWDNRISSYTHNGTAVTNTFDVFGNRVQKINNTKNSTIQYVLDYVLLPDRPVLLQEWDENNNLKVSYLYDPFGMPLMQDSAGTIRYYHFDLYGNTAALTDQNGQVTDKYACDIFGQHQNHQGTSTQPYTFQGMYGVQNEAKDLYYLWARFYDAKTGRFLSKDPIQGSSLNTQALNRYTYGFNNPIRWTDPSGMFAVNNTSYEGRSESLKMLLTGIVNLTTNFNSKWIYDNLSNWQNINRAYIGGINVVSLSPNADIAIEANMFIGSIDYTFLSWNGDFYLGTYKCNLFVSDILMNTGTSPGLPHSSSNLGQLLGRGPYPYSAEEWEDPNIQIQGWRILSSNEKPMAGDIVSYDGHMGIVDIDGLHTVSATPFLGVVSNDWGFRADQKPVFRRYVGQ